VRVPAALTLSRAIDTLSVAVDPASLAEVDVTVVPGRVVGVESDVVVFAQGEPRPRCAATGETERPSPECGRHGVSASTDFDVGTATWSTTRDGLPLPDVKYVAEMRLVLFATDVPPGHEWDPHAGRYEVLWTRILQQAEE
jgi:hypothetical protein